MKKHMTAALLTALLSATLIAPVALAAETKSTVTFEKNIISFEITKVSNIKFGTVEMSGDKAMYDQIYDAGDTFKDLNGVTKIAPLNVTTVDNNPSNKGWELQAKLDGQFTNPQDSSDKLGFASIALKPASVKTSFEDGAKIGVPTGLAPDFINLAAGISAETLVKANANEGMGTWTTLFGELVDDASAQKNPNVVLVVPAGATITEGATYETSITWTLADVP